jgi:hypothetical protein
MKSRTFWTVTLLAGSMLLLSGCAGAADAAAPVSTHTSQAAHHPQPTSSTSAPAPTPASEPSDAAKMICGPKTVAAVGTILALKQQPHIVKTWAHKLYTCTYHLPAGALVLSLQESTDAAAALAHSHELATTFPATSPIEGLANLGFPGYETPDGIVVFVKDNMTLEVDASALPAKIGPHEITGNALAYQLATDVLACWTGQ